MAISYRASVEVVRALLEVYPESAGLPNGVGAYPLHLLCDYGSCVDSLSAVLETQAGAATVDKPMKSLTPLSILNSRMNKAAFYRALQSMQEARNRQQATRERERIRRQEQQRLAESDGDSSNPHDESTTHRPVDRNERMIASFQQNDYWQKAALLILVSYTQQPLSPQGLEDDTAHLVHACAGVPDCPSYLLQFAIQLHLDDLSNRRDHRGRLPLHVAAGSHARALSSSSAKRQKRSHESLRMVLEACPEAACVKDSQGHYPLSVALGEISNGKPWSTGLQELLEANLAALETLNLPDGLYPFVWSKRLTTADHLFQSIRRHPDLFDHRRRDPNGYDETVGC